MAIAATAFQSTIQPKGNPSLSVLGRGASPIAATGAFRAIAAAPFPGWRGQSVYPSGPAFQGLGLTTGIIFIITNPFAFNSAQEAASQAGKNGDREAKVYGEIDIVLAATQFGRGGAQVALRVANIGRIVATAQGNVAAAGSWGAISQKCDTGGTIAGAIVYAGLSLSNLCKLVHSIYVKVVLWKMKDDAGRTQYLQTYLTEEVPEEIIDKKARKLALSEQLSVLKDSILLMKKHKLCDATFNPTNAQLRALIETKLGEDGLKAHGRELLTQRLRSKNIAVLTRVIGSDGVKALQKEKIVLADVEGSQASTMRGYVGRVILYAAGAVALTMLCVYTAGAPFLIATLLTVGVFATEAILSYKAMHAAAKDVSSPPSDYDRIWTIASSMLCVGALGAAIGITTVFSLGMMPLILGGVGGLMWLASNYYQLGCIEKRKQGYMDQLISKPNLQVSEFFYIATHGTIKEVALAWSKLSEDDKRGIQRHLEQGLQTHAEATEAYMQDQQREKLKETANWLATEEENIYPIYPG